MVRRDLYLNKIHKVMNTDDVKIITGVRRSGKTHLLKEIINELKDMGVNKENIIYISFESYKYKNIKNSDELDEYIYKITEDIEGKIYLFFDEVHRVDNWEQSINQYRVDLDSDIYVTGSYAELLGGINATLLSGRYFRIKIYPFSFKEILKYASEENNKELTINNEIDLFNHYLKYGGFPGLLKYDDEDEKLDYLSDIFDSIIFKDIVDLENIGSVGLFRRLIIFLISNVGNIFSANSISKYLKKDGHNIAPQTVLNYLSYAVNSFLVYKVSREDIVGKRTLLINEKYYLVDQGLYYIFNDKDTWNEDSVLENIIYLELLRRNYKVTIGKIYDLEVDFVCKKPNKKIYIQVSKYVLDEKTKERELKSLMKIKDSYPKYLLTLDRFDFSSKGIKHVNIIDFLKSDDEYI